MRFALHFTATNAIAENRHRSFEAQNANLSKPLRLCIKVARRSLQGRSEDPKMGKIAETFGPNRRFGGRNQQKR